MKYFNSLNHYRALSIVLIVTLHVYSTADVALDSYISRFFFNLISGATLNFIFISGFLFYIVFYESYQYSTFVKGRVDRYLKPYIFLSILPILVSVVTIPMYWDNSNVMDYNTQNTGLWAFVSSLKYLVTGAHITAYWYIPFIMLMVLISPFFIAFIKLNFKKQLLVFGIALIIATFVQRPFERTDLFQAVHAIFYFTPLYLMGIMCAVYRTKVYQSLRNKEIYLLAVVLLIVTWQTNHGHIGLYKTEFPTYNGVGSVIIKMVFFCLFYMVWLRRFEHVKNNIISNIASASFSIYFLHVYFLKVVNVIKSYFKLSFEDYSVLSFILIVLFLIIMSILTAKVLHRILPTYTGMLIGYNPKQNKAAQLTLLKSRTLYNIESKQY